MAAYLRTQDVPVQVHEGSTLPHRQHKFPLAEKNVTVKHIRSFMKLMVPRMKRMRIEEESTIHLGIFSREMVKSDQLFLIVAQHIYNTTNKNNSLNSASIDPT